MATGYGKLWAALLFGPKWMPLSNDGRALWSSGLMFSVLTQTYGDLPRHILPTLNGTPEAAAELVAVGLWDETPTGWRMHDWDDHQTSRQHAEEVSKKRAEAGRKGGSARPSKARATSGDKQVANQVAKQPEATAKHPGASGSKPKLEVEEEVEAEVEELPPNPPEGGMSDGQLFPAPAKPKARRRTGVYSDDFEAAWKAFPASGRQAKPKASEAYDKARERADAATILDGIERYAAFVDATDVRVKYMQGWLNDDRWEDENHVPAPRAQYGRPTTEQNVRAAAEVAAYWQQQEAQQDPSVSNRRLSA